MERIANATKKITGVLMILALGAVIGPVNADAPPLIPVQGKLTNAQGLVTGSHDLGFSLYNQESGGTALYSEIQTLDLAQDGIFAAYLGNSGLNLATFLNNGNLWLGISVDGSAELSPRLRLGSVAYAGFAQYCGEANSVQWTNIVDAPDFAQSYAGRLEGGMPLVFRFSKEQGVIRFTLTSTHGPAVHEIVCMNVGPSPTGANHTYITCTARLTNASQVVEATMESLTVTSVETQLPFEEQSGMDLSYRVWAYYASPTDAYIKLQDYTLSIEQLYNAQGDIESVEVQ